MHTELKLKFRYRHLRKVYYITGNMYAKKDEKNLFSYHPTIGGSTRITYTVVVIKR